MKVIIFGATGMVGQGVLRECLQDAEIEMILAVGRTPTGITATKLQELQIDTLWDYQTIEDQLIGYDACFYCIGVSSAGMSEMDYVHMTYNMTLAAAECLARLNPQMTFVYVSAAGSDSSEKSNMMWARVRGRTENAIFKLRFKAAYIFRPGAIQPLNGIQSKTPAYRMLYSIAKPILPWLRCAFPRYITTTQVLGRGMIAVAKHGAPKHILQNKDFDSLQ
jgi:uncharacterized protein YbjT (DUF2867 family)